MEWKLLWTVNMISSWDTIYSVETGRKNDELSKLIWFYSMCHQLNSPHFLTWLQETSCIRAQVNWKQKLVSSDATSLLCSEAAQMNRYILLAFVTWVEIYSPLTMLCGQGLFTWVRPPGFSPASIITKNYLEKKNSLPKRSNPAFLFSSSFGKTLTSWIQSSKFNYWEIKAKKLKF